MNYKITKVAPEIISKIRLNYTENIGGQMTQRDIDRMVRNYITKLQQQGYTREQIEAMNIQVYYTEYER